MREVDSCPRGWELGVDFNQKHACNLCSEEAWEYCAHLGGAYVIVGVRVDNANDIYLLLKKDYCRQR